jgi:hypothetical protein
MCDKLVNFREGDVLLIKGAKVSDYNGKSLNLSIDHSKIIEDQSLP